MNLIVANTQVTRDAQGLFSLNDLHRAGGGEQRHRPKYWLENQQTQELVQEIGKGGNPPLATRRGGKSPGTYVCKELVYAYAMWISPKFHLAVIRAYDAMVSEPADDPVPPAARLLPTAADALKAGMSLAAMFGLEGNQQRLSANRLVMSTVGLDPMQLLGLDGFETDARPLTPTELGQERGISARKMNAALEHAGLQEAKRDGKGSRYWVPTDAGAEFAVLLDTGKKHSCGAPVTQLKWKPAVLDRLPTPEVAS